MNGLTIQSGDFIKIRYNLGTSNRFARNYIVGIFSHTDRTDIYGPMFILLDGKPMVLDGKPMVVECIPSGCWSISNDGTLEKLASKDVFEIGNTLKSKGLIYNFKKKELIRGFDKTVLWQAYHSSIIQ